MANYSKGDHVSWNSEAGGVSGHIVQVHEADFVKDRLTPSSR